ncbi:MAG: CAP domain-containing protein, partial [Polyangiaceae bacterium]
GVVDGALNATAQWVLHEANERHALSVVSVDGASRHFGFAGVVHSVVAFDLDHALDWQEALARIPKNIPVNRFGVSTSPAGRSASVVFGTVALRIEPIARFFAPGASVRLRGEIDQRFEFSHVYLTKPDGGVEERRMPSRALDYATSLPSTGKYRLEVMGDGPSGPVVIANVPLFVGILERPLTARPSVAVSPSQAEARLFDLLNDERRAARLNPVIRDDELRKVALGHSQDMTDHHFFSHVSPSTGGPGDRVRSAALLVTLSAENIAHAPTPEDAHDGLMESPGHRAAMLEPRFTHVGIAAVGNDDGSITVTMLFGKRPDSTTLPRDGSELEAAMLAWRAAQGLAAPKVDLIYRTAARRGLAAYLQSPSPSPQSLSRAVSEAIQSEVDRLRSSRPTSCAHLAEFREKDQIERDPIVNAPGLVKFGLDARRVEDDKGVRLIAVIVGEGVVCR